VRRRTIAIVLAVVLALVAAGLVVWYVSSLKEEKTPPIVTRPVVVAVADIPARTTGEDMVSNGLVQEQQLVETAIAPGAVTSMSALQDMVLSVPVVKGQQLLQAQLAEPVTQALSFRIKPGMRAVTFPIDRENAVGGSIKEGDRVDVIVTILSDDFQAATLPLGSAINPTEAARLAALTGLDLKTVFSSMSLTILQQAEVLAVDVLSPTTTPTTQQGSSGVFSGDSTSTKEDLQEDPVITLMVTPAEAEKLVYAQQVGRLWFLLVPAQDTTKVTTEGVVLPNLLR
jgi:Flp pilus assembly protein CpaB